MNIDPHRIQDFCRNALKNGTIEAAFVEIQKEMFLEWLGTNDALERDQVFHVMRALELFQMKFENYAASGPTQQV